MIRSSGESKIRLIGRRMFIISAAKAVVVFGIVGRDGGYTKKVGDNVILIPTIDTNLITPYSESFQSVVWHCLVSHPILQIKKMKW